MTYTAPITSIGTNGEDSPPIAGLIMPNNDHEQRYELAKHHPQLLLLRNLDPSIPESIIEDRIRQCDGCERVTIFWQIDIRPNTNLWYRHAGRCVVDLRDYEGQEEDVVNGLCRELSIAGLVTVHSETPFWTVERIPEFARLFVARASSSPIHALSVLTIQADEAGDSATAVTTESTGDPKQNACPRATSDHYAELSLEHGPWLQEPIYEVAHARLKIRETRDHISTLEKRLRVARERIARLRGQRDQDESPQ
ncbi:hypothetical protein F5Y16DRAFT_399082 [Xylariaceae sp. FL0255]|nr:hypothetical protein F5Y16DRAFT_399082 [Xylariaceae sp. FL0255]